MHWPISQRSLVKICIHTTRRRALLLQVDCHHRAAAQIMEVSIEVGVGKRGKVSYD